MRGGLKALTLSALAALSLSLLPAPAWAASDVVHTVSTSEAFTRALQDIKVDDKTNATIELNGDIALDESFTGVTGEHVTVRSAEGGTYLLTWPSNTETVELTGAVTFENMHISPKTLYANGHHLTLGKGFGGGADGERRMIVYGGGTHDLTANTHVTVLDGVYKLIAGGNSAGTLTGDTLVEFGGAARFPNASDGADTDPAYIDGTLPGQGDPKGGAIAASSKRPNTITSTSTPSPSASSTPSWSPCISRDTLRTASMAVASAAMSPATRTSP